MRVVKQNDEKYPVNASHIFPYNKQVEDNLKMLNRLGELIVHLHSKGLEKDLTTGLVRKKIHRV